MQTFGSMNHDMVGTQIRRELNNHVFEILRRNNRKDQVTRRGNLFNGVRQLNIRMQIIAAYFPFAFYLLHMMWVAFIEENVLVFSQKICYGRTETSRADN